MIIVESKKRKIENIRKDYPDAIIHDVTSHAEDEFIKLSPFYPHGGIPVPFSQNWTAMSVEGIWQGLKDYVSVGIDVNSFRNGSMKDIKRTKRKYGETKGHRKGVNGTEHLGYIPARKQIYVPTYLWVLENKALAQIEKLRREAEKQTVVLLDYNTNPDVEDPSSPLSHACLIKAYIDGNYPVYEDQPSPAYPEPADPSAGLCPGDVVRHQKFGKGTVAEVMADSGRIIVDFKSEGRKTLSIALAKLEKIN